MSTALRTRPDGSARDIHFRVGFDGMIRSANDRFCELTGLDGRDLADNSVFHVIDPWDIPHVLESLATLTQGLPSVTWEAQLVHERTGDRRVVTWAAAPSADQTAEVFGGDVTDERRRPGTDAAVATRLRMALAVADAAAWDLDLATGELTLDDMFRPMFGIPRHRSVTGWLDLAQYIHEDDRTAFIQAQADLPSTAGLVLDVRLTSRDGLVRHVALRGRLVNEVTFVGIAWDVTATKTLEQQLLQLALRDPLTGVPNRRAFDAVLDQEWNRAQRAGQALALVMIDVDDFKAFNDTRGHVAGDQALTRIGSALEASLNRPADLLCRYGGEEFALLLPDTDADGAAAVAEKAVTAVRESLADVGLTISAGSSATRSDDDSPRTALRRADDACYRAKRAGKGQHVAA